MNEWYRALSALETDTPPLNDTARRRIGARVQEKMKTARKKRRAVPLLIAAVLALTACTAAAVNYQDWFAFLSSPNSEEVSQQLFSDIGTVIGQTVKDKETGVSMTLDGCLFDGKRLTLAVTVKGVDLKAHNRMYASADAEEFWIVSEGAVQRWKEIMAEQAPDAGKEEAAQWEQQFRETMIDFGGNPEIFARSLDGEEGTLRLEIIGTDPQNFWRGGDTMEIHLKNLRYRDEVLVPGGFTFTFQMPELKADVVRCYRGDLKVENDFIAVRVKNITITPSDIVIETEADAFYDEKDRTILSEIRLKDGQTFGFNNHGRSYWRDEDTLERDYGRISYRGSYAPWQYVAPAEVEAICFGYDTWIELSELEEYTPEE